MSKSHGTLLDDLFSYEDKVMGEQRWDRMIIPIRPSVYIWITTCAERSICLGGLLQAFLLLRGRFWSEAFFFLVWVSDMGQNKSPPWL